MPQSLKYPVRLPDGVVYWSPVNVEYPVDHPHSMQNGVIKNLRQQLAAANKRIEDAEKQKPVGIIESFTGDEKFVFRSFLPVNEHTELYAAPIPSPDVAELHLECKWAFDAERHLRFDALRRLEEIERNLNEERESHAQLQSRCFDNGGSQSVFDRVKELERKLAEQQAYLDSHEPPEFLTEIGRKELNNLLAAEREACAKVCDDESSNWTYPSTAYSAITSVAAAIRTRNYKKDR